MLKLKTGAVETACADVLAFWTSRRRWSTGERRGRSAVDGEKEWWLGGACNVALSSPLSYSYKDVSAEVSKVKEAHQSRCPAFQHFVTQRKVNPIFVSETIGS